MPRKVPVLNSKYAMNKLFLVTRIISRLEADHRLLLQAAQSSHAAAVHEENIPDSKYETLALEASYIAQGQANRAQQIWQALNAYRQLEIRHFSAETPIRLTALVVLEDEDGRRRHFFLGPAAGGLKLRLDDAGQEVTVVTPESPFARQLLGLRCGDSFELSSGGRLQEYEVVDVV